MERNRTKGIVVALVIIAVILLASAVAFSGILNPNGNNTTSTSSTTTTSTTSSTSTTTTSTTSATSTTSTNSNGLLGLTKGQSGLVSADSLTTGTMSNWNFSASPSGSGTQSENSSGLFLGLQPQATGKWAENFGEMTVGNAHVYSANISLPQTIASGSFSVGIYVSTLVTYPQNPSSVNYLACGGEVSSQGSGGHDWQVVYGTGNLSGASQTNTLYFHYYPYGSGPLSQTCTIMTNGANFLSVYIGGTQVYSNSSMNLQIASPFNTYLEVTGVNMTQSMNGSFTNFYTSLNDTVTVTNAPSGGIVQVTGTNTPIANATVGSNGVATLTLPASAMPQTGVINVYNSSGVLVATTTTAVTLWGGDSYSVG